MPNAFPATESGVEIKILERIFSDPEDAERWLKFNLKPETVEVLAERFHLSVSEMQRGDRGMGFRVLMFEVDGDTDLLEFLDLFLHFLKFS